MTNDVAVKDVLMKRGRYHDDRTAEQVADLIENAEKERKKRIIVNAVGVIASVIFVVVLKKFCG